MAKEAKLKRHRERVKECNENWTFQNMERKFRLAENVQEQFNDWMQMKHNCNGVKYEGRKNIKMLNG